MPTGSVVDQADIGTSASPPPFVRLPDLRNRFARRAARLGHLADGHPLGDYLALLARIAAAQQDALGRLGPGTMPAATGRTPLDHMAPRGDQGWLPVLRGMLADLRPDLTLPVDVEALADRVLAHDPRPDDLALAPFVHAALEVWFTRMAAMLDPGDLGHERSLTTCPACGALPVASTVEATGSLSGSRYLHCGLCGTAWHFLRVKCAVCEGTAGIAYHEIEGGGGAAKAETCDGCGAYGKIFYLARDAAIDPVADDLATLGLDLLVGEAGWARAWPNPYLAAERPR